MITTSRRRSWKKWVNCPDVCSQIVLKCLYLTRIGRPDILWSVSRSYHIDTSLWQTFSTFDIQNSSHSSHVWSSSILSSGSYSSTLQIGSVPKLRFCWWPWRLEINLKVDFMYFRMSNICSNKLDWKEANISVSLFPQNRELFRWRSVCEWTVPPDLDLWDVVTEVLQSWNNVPTDEKIPTPKQKSREVAGNCASGQCP